MVQKKRPALRKNPIGVGPPPDVARGMTFPSREWRIWRVSGFAKMKNTSVL